MRKRLKITVNDIEHNIKEEDLSMKIDVDINNGWFIEINGHKFRIHNTLEAQRLINTLT